MMIQSGKKLIFSATCLHSWGLQEDLSDAAEQLLQGKKAYPLQGVYKVLQHLEQFHPLQAVPSKRKQASSDFVILDNGEHLVHKHLRISSSITKGTHTKLKKRSSNYLQSVTKRILKKIH